MRNRHERRKAKSRTKQIMLKFSEVANMVDAVFVGVQDDQGVRRREGPRPCENSTRYNRTRNFEACCHAQSKKMQKFLLRSALQPN
jgi:hypothetical protein